MIYMYHNSDTYVKYNYQVAVLIFLIRPHRIVRRSYMSKDNSFGKKLQQIRKSKGLTQEKLAELAGVHEKHISKLELGTYKPSFDTLNKILSALDLRIDEVGVNLEKVSVNDNPFYIKSVQILNNATEQELEFYYGLLKQGQKAADIFSNN